METTNSHPIFNLRKAYLFHSDVETRQLRSFGVVFFVFFAVVIGLSPLLSGASPRGWALIVGGIFLCTGLARPRALRQLFQAWMVFGGILGFINTRIILGIVFFVLLTPISIIRRMMGKDSLGLKFDPEAKSYRVSMENHSKLDMSRQF